MPSVSDGARAQAEQYEASNGAEANLMHGLPIVVITSVGAKTGALRKTPLMRVEHEGRYLAVASMGGADKVPVWYWNMVKNPHVELQDGAVKRDYMARELSGDQRATWWARAVEAFPNYAEYQTKTDRLIAILLLEPIDD